MSYISMNGQQIKIRDSTSNKTWIIPSLPSSEQVTYTDARVKNLAYPLELYHSYEVYLLRVYCIADQWHWSTKRKQSAFDAYWGPPRKTPSFGACFEEVLKTLYGDAGRDILEQRLDKNYVYYFLVPLQGSQRTGGKDTGFVARQFWLAGTYGPIGGGDIEPAYADYEGSGDMWSQVPRVQIESYTHLIKYIDDNYSCGRGDWFSGLIQVGGEGTRPLRIVHPDYLYHLELRANEPNLHLRYLQLLAAKDANGARHLLLQHEPTLAEFAGAFQDMIEFHHRVYVQRYVEGRYVPLERSQHAILKKSHEMYLETGAPVTQETIANELLSKPYIVLWLFKNPDTMKTVPLQQRKPRPSNRAPFRISSPPPEQLISTLI